MTAEKAAEKWGCSVKTVYRYCKKGLICCEKIKNNWNIPDNQCKPLYVRKKDFTQEEVEFYILKAINENKYISYKIFSDSFDKDKFQHIVDNMISKKLIIVSEADSRVIPNDYLISDRGESIIYEKREKAIKLGSAIICDFTIKLVFRGE